MAKRKSNNLKKLLNNQILFLVVLIVSIIHLVGYINRRSWNSVFFFLLLAVVTYYFSKSPTLILIVAIIGTNFYRTSNRMKPRVEGNRNRGSTEPDEDDDDDDDDTGMDLSNLTTTGAPLSTATMEGLDEKLASAKQQQQQMVGLLDKMTPLVQESMKMLDNLPSGAIENLSENLKKVNQQKDAATAAIKS